MFLFFGHLQTSKVSILVSLNNKLSICRLEIYVVCKAVVVLKNIMYGVLPTSFPFPNIQIHTPISIMHSASADVSGDGSAAKYSEMSVILGVLSHIWPP